MRWMVCLFACVLGLGASSCNLNFNFQQEVSSADLDYKLKYGIYGFVSPDERNSSVNILRYLPANEFSTGETIHAYKEASVSITNVDKGKKADLIFSEVLSLANNKILSAYYLLTQDLSIEAQKEYKLAVVIEGKTYESRTVRVPSKVKELFIDRLFSRRALDIGDDADTSGDAKEWYLRIQFKDLPDVEYYRLVVHEIRKELDRDVPPGEIPPPDGPQDPNPPQNEPKYNLVSYEQDDLYVDARSRNLELIKRDVYIGTYGTDESPDFEAIAVTIISADEMYYEYHLARDSDELWDPNPVFGEPVVLPENVVYDDATGAFGAFRMLHKRFKRKDIKVADNL